jgi:hypothetical protein
MFHTIVPRVALAGEWDGSGKACWKWLVFSDLTLPIFMPVCALLQRMAI